MKAFKQFLRGLWEENPIFRIVLGMCPTLAITTALDNALGMGMAATGVLIGSNVMIAAVRRIVPDKVRIPCFIVIIATFVTIVDLLMNAYALSLYKRLGIFIPLIVVNCIIMGRAEAFAARNPVSLSLADGIGMGLGFTLAIAVVATIRELLGNGSLTLWAGLSWKLPAYSGRPLILMILPSGGFITLGCLLAAMNHVQGKIAARRQKSFTPPDHLGCRRCLMACAGELAQSRSAT